MEAHTVRHPSLSPREQQIVRLVADSCSNAEIAARLGIKVQTVKNRLCEIYDKTGTKNRVRLALLTRSHKSEKNKSIGTLVHCRN